jgi:parallel beta-helix repeat protein
LAVTGAGNKNGINCATENSGTNVAEIIDCEVYGNSMGVHAVTANDADNCSPYIHNNVIHSNGVRGIGNMTFSSATIDGNLIYGNGNGASGEGGIGNRDDSTALIVNNVIYENDRFGIAVRDRAAPKIVNNTIVFHDAADGGAITVLQEENQRIPFVLIINNIIAHNRRSLISRPPWTCSGNDYNDLWDSAVPYLGFSEPSNDISRDPLFVDIGNQDFHLQWGSPCVDSGKTEGAPGWDIDGDPRPQFETHDIGADEYFVRGLGQTIVVLEVVSGVSSAHAALALDRWDLNKDGRISIEDAVMVLQEVSQLR